MNDNSSIINEHTEGYYQENFADTPVMDNSLDPNFGERMSFERNDSLKPFFVYETSAFKSTPQTNKLNMPPNSDITDKMGTPVESMKVVAGFAPKSKNDSLIFNSPGTNMIEDMKNNINSIYQQPSTPYYVPNPTITSSVVSEYCQTNTFPNIQQPLDFISSLPESSSKKSKQSTESVDEKSIKEDSPGIPETDKKEKNRVSAQKCRKRKKQYIESLEQKIAELSAELVKCKEEIKSLKEAQSANLIAENNVNEYQSKYKELISALKIAVDKNQSDEILKQLIGELNVFYNVKNLA